jgi:GNAT superfamily N-acetyltransferase
VTLEVRPAVVEDARGIASVHVRSWRSGYRGLLRDDTLDGHSVEARERRWTDLLRRGDGGAFTLVASAGGTVAGFCSVFAPGRDPDAGPRTAEIAALYVDPARWREGVGAALLSRALDALPADAWDAVTLWVIDGNGAARGFYERFGFAPDGASRRDAIGPAGLEDHPPQVRLRARLPGRAGPTSARPSGSSVRSRRGMRP